MTSYRSWIGGLVSCVLGLAGGTYVYTEFLAPVADLPEFVSGELDADGVLTVSIKGDSKKLKRTAFILTYRDAGSDLGYSTSRVRLQIEPVGDGADDSVQFRNANAIEHICSEIEDCPELSDITSVHIVAERAGGGDPIMLELKKPTI